ncbi:MAG: sigma-70 family RNA polymerase sigma factor [Candidatus Latescibacteria bacterium]|jgi:RNA polymerase sigma-70 factor (ECF subfamily)|nr:sigma-70 family RNA polymerase sigma factor [Candidatus Latescibacterota bacterium]
MTGAPEGSRPGRADSDRLIRRAQDGDQTAFETLYRENAGRIYALSLRLVSDPRRAEELTQGAFVRAWEKLGSFRGESTFVVWLHRLTVNLMLEERRSEGRRTARVLVTDDEDLLHGSASAGSPEARIDLERAIASLPSGARTAFVLHDVEGYRHEEIAEMTGLAIGTSKAQLHRARRLLRKALER